MINPTDFIQNFDDMLMRVCKHANKHFPEINDWSVQLLLHQHDMGQIELFHNFENKKQKLFIIFPASITDDPLHYEDLIVGVKDYN